MKARYKLAAIAAAATIGASAAPVSPEKALEIVNGPASRNIIRALGGSPSFKIAAKRLTPAGNATAYYLMTRGGMPGYVVVAGDDALGAEILGYTDSGTLADMPDNMRAWLDQAGRAVDYLNSHPGAAVKKAAVRSRSASVGPLLGEIHWGQQPYYNRKAPSTSYPIGCVATAVGQVMYSHRWPLQGTGSHSYVTTTHKLEISQDFSTNTYQWDMMANTLDSSSPTETVDAVATMLYDFAVSVEMDFQVGGSGAYSEKIAGALANHFGYSKQIHCAKRDAYTGEEWLQMLHDDLDNGCAVVYGGATSGMGMGHSFVCDGYNEDGMYHINWGWNGSGNGYFALNALAYDYIDMTTGQSMKDGFNYHQDMVVGMRPDRDGSTQWRDYEFFTEELMAVDSAGQPADFQPVTIACGAELPIYLYEA
ncbi:MAG: C10 family peptidase, partial [Muribaculaceae bacterium]|nr:C10 family peptidase [Muribaculaceae bacterium]